MIIDNINNAGLYFGISRSIATALKYLVSTDFAQLEPGRYEIGDGCYAMVQDYTTKHTQEKRWEAHQAYIDVQFIASGTEFIGYTPLDGMTEVEDYNFDKDIAFYSGSGQFLLLQTGSFMILYPREGHMPGVAAAEPGEVRKVVVKVPV